VLTGQEEILLKPYHHINGLVAEIWQYTHESIYNVLSANNRKANETGHNLVR
jgi:hypothetical protein